MAAGLYQCLSQAFVSTTKRLIWSLDNWYGRASKVGDHTFFDLDDFPWIPEIEADWRKVRAELDALLPYAAHLINFQDMSKDASYISQDDGWKSYVFYAYGLKSWRNCRRCPETAALLRRIPGMKTALFSIFMPHKHLRRHRGPYKGVLRFHLALKVPEPAEECGIEVGSDVRHWQEGRALIFDDTKPHEAWNHTGETRVVLFADIMRPLRFPANVLNTILVWVIAFSPYVIGEAGSYLRWEKRFEAVLNKGTAPD